MQSPQQSFSKLMNLLQSGNFEKAEDYLITSGSLVLDDKSQNEILSCIMKNISYNIISSKDEFADVVLCVEIVNVDMQVVLGLIFKELGSSDFRNAIVALDATKSQIDELVKSIYIRNIENSHAKKKYVVDVVMQKSGLKWKVKDSMTFANAITGGLLTAMESQKTNIK